MTRPAEPRRRRPAAACGLVAVVTLAASTFSASRGVAELPGISVGFAGVTKTAAWTPVWVRLPGDAPAGRVRVWADDPEGQPVASPWKAFELVAGRHEAVCHVRCGRPAGLLRVEIEAGQGRATSYEVEASPIESTATVVLAIGELPSLTRAAALLESDDGRRPRIVTVSQEDLPAADPLDFDAADVVVLCGSTGRPSPNLAAALDGWVRRGGFLVYMTGGLTGELTGGEAAAAAPFAAWLPGELQRFVPLRRTASVETFARASRPLGRSGGAFDVPSLVIDPESFAGVVLLSAGPDATDLPLATRTPHGFGQIAWAGLDLDGEPFRSWPGTDTLLLELLDREPGRGGRSGEVRRERLDLDGQLKRAVDRFEGVAAVPFGLVALLGGGCVASLYPLSWWLTTRGGLSGRGAWLVLPGLILIFTGLAAGIARAWKGDRWQASRAGLVDIDLFSGDARGLSVAGLWSPANAEIELTAATGLASTRPIISWMAATGRNFGGPDAMLPHPSLAAGPYRYGQSLAALEAIPLAAATSCLWEARWFGRSDGPLPLAGRLDRSADGTLRGSIESRLDVPLDDCILVQAGWLYDLGRLAPGERFDPAARGPRSLAAAITRRSSAGDRDRAVRYDEHSRDPWRILEVAGFHEAAGGESFTALAAGRLARFDLSRLLEGRLAVLVGRGPAAVRWTPSSSTGEKLPSAGGGSLWRIVLPLGRELGAEPR